VSEQGWLIELPTTVGRDPYWSHLDRSSPEWLSAERGFFHWSYDSREAMRFARKKDAEDFLRCYARPNYKAVQPQAGIHDKMEAIVTEHGWSDMEEPAASEPPVEGQASEYLAGHKGSCRLRHWDRNTPCVCDCSFDPPPAPASTPAAPEPLCVICNKPETDDAHNQDGHNFQSPAPAATQRWRCKGCGEDIPEARVSEPSTLLNRYHNVGNALEEWWCGPVVPETPGKEGEARPAGGTEALQG
jgi:hypothetical protein